MTDSPPPLSILATLAVRKAFEATILPAFAAATGLRAEIGWHPTSVILRELAAGSRPDLVVLLAPGMAELVAQGLVEPASRLVLAESRIGLAVRAGVPKPGIATLDAFRDALLGARSLAYSRAGASGIHLETVLERLGIAEAVRARATVVPTGFTAERLLTGEADLAAQQVSELMMVPGIKILGRIPEEVQEVAVVTAGRLREAAQTAAADRFLAALAGPEAAAAFRAGGLDPVG